MAEKSHAAPQGAGNCLELPHVSRCRAEARQWFSRSPAPFFAVFRLGLTGS